MVSHKVNPAAALKAMAQEGGTLGEDKGMGEGDPVEIMLPHSYQALEELEGAMLEMDQPLLPRIDGNHPIIIIDTSGACAQHLLYVKGALKRALHAHMSAKKTFQLIRFAPSTGDPRLWAQEMVPPTERALQAAEAWIDAIVATPGARMLNGIRAALAHQDCDEIYVLSSADCDRSIHDSVLAGIRAANVREVAIHTVGLAPDASSELLLRNISESNHGDFRLKNFGAQTSKGFCTHDAKWTSWRTNLVNGKSKQMAESFKKQRMTIGSQLQIIGVMSREEQQKEGGWRQEWQCAQRLLTTNDAGRQGSYAHDGITEFERKQTRTLAARVGGGFAYLTDEVDLGLESLFEHKSMLPWTTNTESYASGPKVPDWDADVTRTHRFPPLAASRTELSITNTSVDRLPPLAGASGGSRPSRPRSSRPTTPSGGGGGGGGGLGSARRPMNPGTVNPWAPATERSAVPRPARPMSAARTASADRAAGGRAASPAIGAGSARSKKGSGSRNRSRSRSQSPVPIREKRKPPSGQPRKPVKPAPLRDEDAVSEEPSRTLERRWSF
eukprot:TRINITY_DN4783_c0_g1_i6.p1 TRINITY_DN4783_c0_g1~~TRINITY_DN4783_c0_g1_i6.p1  ORF type:complete len:556 (-),score=102.62 TRINITY_DN4783_c0_g1_i6:266-1933(-)